MLSQFSSHSLAMLYRLTSDQRIVIHRSSDVYFVMQPCLRKIQYIDRMKEHLFVIGLMTSNRIMFIDLVSVGTVNATLAGVREIFKAAIIKSATSIIIVHNHPSDNPNPSQTDINLTRRIEDAGKLLDIKLMDSMILTENCGYYSFADSGTLLMPNENGRS